MDFSTFIDIFRMMQLIGRCDVYSGKYSRCLAQRYHDRREWWGVEPQLSGPQLTAIPLLHLII